MCASILFGVMIMCKSGKLLIWSYLYICFTVFAWFQKELAIAPEWITKDNEMMTMLQRSETWHQVVIVCIYICMYICIYTHMQYV